MHVKGLRGAVLPAAHEGILPPDPLRIFAEEEAPGGRCRKGAAVRRPVSG
jgi:hypothetical protein